MCVPLCSWWLIFVQIHVMLLLSSHPSTYIFVNIRDKPLIIPATLRGNYILRQLPLLSGASMKAPAPPPPLRGECQAWWCHAYHNAWKSVFVRWLNLHELGADVVSENTQCNSFLDFLYSCFPDTWNSIMHPPSQNITVHGWSSIACSCSSKTCLGFLHVQYYCDELAPLRRVCC